MCQNILYIGKFYPAGVLKTIVEDTEGKVAFSNHNFEKSLISGFACQTGINLRVLTAPLVFSYPHNNKRLVTRKEKYIDENGVPVRSLGFPNLAVANKISVLAGLTAAIVKELKYFEGKEVKVVVNTPTPHFSAAVFIAKKLTRKNITTALIVPDVPQCMAEMNGLQGLKGRIVRILNSIDQKLSKRYDKYVLLTDAMNDFYGAAKDDYMVMEGLMDENRLVSSPTSLPAQRPQKEIVLYTGTLRRIFGVMNLVQAFIKGNFSNAELWICGSGEAAAEISELAKTHPNIKFYGLVESRRALELQSQATLLVNPRPSEGNYTKYSFPSKTIEYLLAGKSILANRLPGIPREYDQFLIYPQNESVEGWVEAMRLIFEMDYKSRCDRANAGRDYIIKYKTASVQCRRIVDFL